jgi:putative ABC transport system ATP-binding protein
LTGIQNIVLSMNVSHSAEINKKQYAQDLLSSIGIDEETANRKVLQLSGGEQQRVAIARALAHHPEIIIADEPTANLDRDTEDDILQIFSNLAHQENKCVIIVSHSNRVASVADQILRIQNGTVISKSTENSVG